jgi:hypothetical protein
VDGQGGKGLCRALREANVRQTLLLRCVEDVCNAVRDVMESKLIDGKVPEAERCWRVVNRLLGVLVSSIVAKLRGLVKMKVKMKEMRPTQTS